MSRPTIDRRVVLAGFAGALAAPAFGRPGAPAIKAIAFDGFTVLDPRGVNARARLLLGERGDALVAQWSAKLFGYSWLETSAGRYADFRTLADASLRYVGESMKMPLDARTRDDLIEAYDALDLWPDVKPSLARLRAAGIRLAFLSNLGVHTLNANMLRNGIAHYFEAPLSTDMVRRFKPAPEAYGMAMRAFGLPRSEIGFAAFGGWDAAGASWFGYRTAWINRFDLPQEPLDVQPAIVTRGFEGVLTLARPRS